MSQLSQHRLAENIEREIRDIFQQALIHLSSPSATSQFIEDLLSPTEQIMLGKRLAIAYLLCKKYSQRDICTILKVSLGTVNKVSQILQRGENGYINVIDKLMQIERMNEFFNKISSLVDHLMLPKGGNWSSHYQRVSQEKRKNRKSF